MNSKKVMAGLLTGSMVAAMSMAAFADPVAVVYTDDKTEVAADFSNVNLATIIDETTADAEIAEFTYTLTCAEDVSFNEYAYINFVVTVDGTATEYKVQGIGSSTDFSEYVDDEWTSGFEIEGATLKLESAIPEGATFKVEAYTQSWAGAANEVYSVDMTAAATADASPLPYLAAIVALAGAAMIASKQRA